MNKILNYLFSSSSHNEGINIIIMGTIAINDNDIIIDKIIEDIIFNNNNNKIEVNNKYCNEILLFDYATLHYYIKLETNNFITFEDEDLLENKLNKIINRNCNLYKKENEKEINNIWHNDDIKNVKYIIIYEDYYDNSYHDFIINNISVNTYIEFKTLLIKETNELKKQVKVGFLFVFYIINNEENIKWRRYDENNL